ncbi:WD40/YVTN/BNR-like repeat-containing protein [Clostridium beijerinckii]|uniref:Uncharacterized protein n=1 Tax=Clostridium beijerinckii TaxID=1520 RepID=A0A1B9BN82_CLOBE|nr:hypothetical protein [Clostridium beijerinckii]AQS03358.1 hypothetical protein CLBIJ_07660 [Clostridium beijerinckii]MBA2886814.1 hypothetical protein [Clostridium beijerinckii]MBA2901548.1 hypothetical protein [Clostridium beijerinckii]MBA2911254.1 hypothetical protein [Clostridium beijerinckii]MBA9017106.1 hypothetical protein [Clostridium beijerinckii]
MKKYRQIIRRSIFLSMMSNLIFVFIYCISLYELYTLSRFGRFHNNTIILFGCITFILVWLTYVIIKSVKKPISVPQQIIEKYKFNESNIKVLQEDGLEIDFRDIKSFRINRKYVVITLRNRDILVLSMIDRTDEEIGVIKKSLNEGKIFKSNYKTIWIYIAMIVIATATLFYGAKIYNDTISYNGKLSWFLSDLKNKKTVKFEHNNIYENGIEGIFADINKEIHMPDKLYVSSNFNFNFNSDGTITSFDTYLYGKDNKGKLESYLISYNNDKSDKITIYLNGQVDADYNEDKLLEPLLSTMKAIPLKDTVSKWNENKYGIIYYGNRSFGYNTDGITYINPEGSTKAASKASSEIIGYAVSVFVPGKEKIYTPYRYILTEDLNNIKTHTPLKEDKDKSISQKSNNQDEFYMSDQVGYRLEVTGAAAGSRSYSLKSTIDGGNTWTIVNEDPFAGKTGVAAGISFLNDKLGFLCLSHSGGSNGELYRTEDGGVSYKKVSFPERKVTLDNGEKYNPFDLPDMPYEQDGILNVLIGQGSDGDYNGGCKALYESKDEGVTWQYVKEVDNK